MLKDSILVWKLRHGSEEALRRIYEKHKDDMLRLASSLLNNSAEAEDLVHDAFIAFIKGSSKFQLYGSLKGYLITCVANRVRNFNRSKHQQSTISLGEAEIPAQASMQPEQWIIYTEEFSLLTHALAQLPYDQREVIVLRLQGGLVFREIAKMQKVSIKTIQSRYRYGLEKLRSHLNGKLVK